MENAGFYDDLGKNITAQYDECLKKSVANFTWMKMNSSTF